MYLLRKFTNSSTHKGYGTVIKANFKKISKCELRDSQLFYIY